MGQGGQDGVNTSGEEDGRGNDEKVLQDEVDEVVGVDLCGEQTGDVADDLEEQTDGEGGEVPGFVAYQLEDVDDEEEEEEDDAEEGESERGRVAVDDDGGVIGSTGERPVGIDVASPSSTSSCRATAAFLRGELSDV